MIAGLSPAYADSNEAMCEVRKDGEICSLSPRNQPNYFKDQRGHKVVRMQAGGGRSSLHCARSASWFW
jgi:hypothetical protein